MKPPAALKQTIDNMPTEPGIYMMKDLSGIIIYIGKAGVLKKRVSSYFQKDHPDPKTRVLVKSINSIEYIITDSEIEALILERNLVRKHKPRYNIRLKDDKRYPYIAITLSEDYPRVIYTRKTTNKKYRYFGPYTDARAAKNTVNTLNSIFKLHTCKKHLPFKKGERPCLNYQMKKCHGPCIGKISREDYNTLINNTLQFIEGNIDPVISDIEKLMKKYSENMEYEKASKMRDVILDIQTISQNQIVNIPAAFNQDFISTIIKEKEALLVLFEFRKGVLLGRKISVFENIDYSNEGEIIKSFILDHYQENEIPHKITISNNIEDHELIKRFLLDRSSHKVSINRARTSEEKSIIKMIDKNVEILFADRAASQEYKNLEEGLNLLKEILNLESAPLRMECFDISNFHGTNAVASMVSFHKGEPDKKNYRRYKIKAYDTPNDPAMIHEAVARRIQHLINEELALPDLMIIDGGKAQLSRAIEAASNFEISIKIISLAKREEEIFYHPKKPSIIIPLRSPAVKIIQSIRDEAHRFAITYHRNLRDKELVRSELDDIPDIGDKTKKLLLKHMKSIENIKNSDISELNSISGIGDKTAIKIYNHFH